MRCRDLRNQLRLPIDDVFLRQGRRQIQGYLRVVCNVLVDLSRVSLRAQHGSRARRLRDPSVACRTPKNLFRSSPRGRWIGPRPSLLGASRGEGSALNNRRGSPACRGWAPSLSRIGTARAMGSAVRRCFPGCQARSHRGAGLNSVPEILAFARVSPLTLP